MPLVLCDAASVLCSIFAAVLTLMYAPHACPLSAAPMQDTIQGANSFVKDLNVVGAGDTNQCASELNDGCDVLPAAARSSASAKDEEMGGGHKNHAK